MNIHSQADASAVRLRLAIEESAFQRDRLHTTVTRTHALMDQYNRERQTIVPVSAVTGLSDARRALDGGHRET